MQNEPVLWDSSLNSTEEKNEIAWKRIADSFGIPNGGVTILVNFLRSDQVAAAATSCFLVSN